MLLIVVGERDHNDTKTSWNKSLNNVDNKKFLNILRWQMISIKHSTFSIVYIGVVINDGNR